MARTTRSAKDLWSLVCGSSVLNCKELVEYELQENGEHIINGILFFEKASPQSLDSLKKSVEEVHFEFVSKLSKLLNVDAMQCYELFVSYTTYEFKGTQKTLEAHLGNERHVQSLLLEVWHYYFGERLYYLLILKHILGHWQDEADQYKDIYEKFLDKHNKDNAVVHKLINQMEASINSELPTKDTHGAHMTDLLAYHWVTFVLKEQTELLQLMLLYYKVIEPSINDVQKMFSLFQGHGFGLRQSFRIMLSDDTRNLINYIGYLESFVIIQCFILDWLFKCKESGMIGEHYLLKNEKALRMLNDSILALGSYQSHSPIMLAWMLVVQCSEIPDLLVHCNKLGKTALQLDVFNYLIAALNSSVFSGVGVVSDVANHVAYSLLSCVLTQFDLQHLGSLQPLFTIASTVLQYPLIADDFWKKGEDGGIGDLFSYCLEMFSIEFYPLLDICSSLCQASRESCSKVTEQLKNLTTFTEFWENIDERDIVATPEPNVWQLVKDRPIYGDSHIIIPKETLGIVLKQTGKKGSSIIQWKVNLNGWQVCLKEIYLKLQEMNYSTALISSDSIHKITSVAKLVNSILRTDIDMRFHLCHLINVLFSILQRSINSSSPSLEFISVCLQIAATLSKNEMSDVWQQLAHIQLLPFMTYAPKDVSDMLRGMCMNTGILGQIIASKECVSGDYSVCCAFLDLVTNVSLTVVKEDDTFLACVIYILRELFSYFHKWYYNEHQQRILLGQKCLNLLHSLFSVEKDRLKALGKAQELCIYSLLHFEAGQTLLKIVCTGEEVIQQTILKQNSELGEQIASMIRLSLSVLNRLLLLRHKTTISSKTEVSPLEAVLFSTPGHTNQPQVVLMVAHYVFQHYNPRLATLAVQLLKRFAKEFPMSLLACFGSEAEAIRDHFLARLSSVYEDIRFKVSEWEFLTVCVVQQPGLIEMFINVKRKCDKEKKEKNKSCLECVKQILKDKKNESKAIYPRELLCAAVEFIHALWVGHQALAMEALKSDTEFWNLMCHSLLTDEFSHDNPGINAYIIRTLALEVFYSGKNRLNENLKSIFQEIHTKNSLLKWSKHIHCSKFMDNEQGDGDHFLDVSSIDFQDSFALLTAWRDFLLIVAVYEPLVVSSDCKKQILKDILEHLHEEMKSNNSRALILLSELFLMLARHWQRELISLLNSDEMKNPIFQILNEVAYNAENIHPREQLVVVSIAVFIVRLQSETDLKIKNIKEWIVPCCQLLKKASILIHQPLDPKNIEGILKLPIVIVSLLNELIQVVKDWLPVIKNYSVIPLLVSLLIKSLKLNVGLQLAHGIIILFLSLGSDKKAAEALCNTGFMPEVTLILSDIDMAAYISEKRKNLGSQKPKLSRVDVYFAFLRFVTALLQTLGNYFLQDCWNFIGVHQEAMHITLVEMKNSFVREGIQDAILTCTFILQLSSHQHIWRLEHPRSLKMLLVDVCNCIYGTVAISSKPELLKYLVTHKKMLDSKPLRSLETESLLKRTTSEDDSQTPAEVEEIQQKLYELLAVTLTILTKYCPEMYETMSGHTIDYAQWQLLPHVSFSIPSLDRDGPLCFGTILACVNMCLKLLVKNEKTPSPRKTTDNPTVINRHLLMHILEISLAILLSQSTIALTHPSLPARDKQLVRRELAAELNSMNITMNRYLRRGPLSPAGISTPSISPGISSKSHPTEFPFMKLISNLVDKLFK